MDYSLSEPLRTDRRFREEIEALEPVLRDILAESADFIAARWDLIPGPSPHPRIRLTLADRRVPEPRSDEFDADELRDPAEMRRRFRDLGFDLIQARLGQIVDWLKVHVKDVATP